MIGMWPEKVDALEKGDSIQAMEAAEGFLKRRYLRWVFKDAQKLVGVVKVKELGRIEEETAPRLESMTCSGKLWETGLSSGVEGAQEG